jgi:hypothetical protein
MVAGATRDGDRPAQTVQPHPFQEPHPFQGASSSWAVTRVARTGQPGVDHRPTNARTDTADLEARSLDDGDIDTVVAIIRCLGADPAEMVTCPDGTQRSLSDALSRVCDIDRPAALALEVLASRAPEFGESRCLQALAEGYPGAEPAEADLLDLLHAFPSARPPVQELVSALAMRPSPCDRKPDACRKERRPPQNGPLWYASHSGTEPVTVRRADDLLPAAPPDRAHQAGGLWSRLQHGAYVFVRAAAAKAPFTRAHKAS